LVDFNITQSIQNNRQNNLTFTCKL